MEEELKINSDRMALLVIGMAGTGKTTFVNVIQFYLNKATKYLFKVVVGCSLYREYRSCCSFYALHSRH